MKFFGKKSLPVGVRVVVHVMVETDPVPGELELKPSTPASAVRTEKLRIGAVDAERRAVTEAVIDAATFPSDWRVVVTTPWTSR